ncbi:C4-dicarboxylate TRAP transporter substrate-binding protein [Sneathiella limimaris]|uniref:C4-dicarboxylate TRAP transporter substrate-binding protein n=1 Tax=Sneathiella limimaris TaxID=1964213 RepID=UPI00146C7B8D|nr:C4-dicarboxylate TRAP transporter substrate-binding protein [Sneathiella limimaris]
MLKFIRSTKKALVTAAAGALLLGMSASVVQAIELRFSELGPPRGPRAEALQWWADELAKRTNGEITVKFFWSQSLVKAKENLKAVGAGLAEVGTVMGIYTPRELPVWNYANAPFGVGDPWVGMRTWYELRQTSEELQAEAKKRNIKIFTNYTTGPVDLMSKEPIKSAKDIDGKKVRVSGGWVDMMKNLGASPVNIGFGELYQALDRGTVDATTNYIALAKAYKMYEVAGNFSVLKMGQVLGYGAAINLNLYNSFTAEQKKIFDQLGVEFMDEYGRRFVESEKSAQAAMEAGIDGHKVQFHEVSDIDVWKEAASGYTAEWIKQVAKKGVDGEAFIKKFEEVRAKYENELKTKGYPWDR